MRYIRWIVLLGGLLALLPASAQVALELRGTQDQYLLGEPILIFAQISNQSGQPLELGREEGWLTFAVEKRNGAAVGQTDKVALPGPFRLESAQVARVRVDLEPAFRVDQPGNYLLAATLKIPGWPEQVVSPTVNFTIIRGTLLWEQEFGVPADPLAPSTNRTPEVRKYSLLQANTVKQLRLYVRISDPATDRIFATVPIGPMVSFGRPERQLDRFSNLHILHQNGARTCNYVVVNPQGRIGLRETYEFTNTRPRLRADTEGKVLVSGGQRRPSASDLPLPETTTPATNAPAATP